MEGEFKEMNVLPLIMNPSRNLILGLWFENQIGRACVDSFVSAFAGKRNRKSENQTQSGSIRRLGISATDLRA
jgi:hypothetical protein